MSRGGAAIEAIGLTKRYGERTVVDELTISVPPGCVFGFLGPNGAGKTTTMRLLTTLTPPTSGTAWVAGHRIDDRRAVTQHIGYLPEEPPLFDVLTGREQLAYAAGLRNDDSTPMQRIDEWLEQFDLVAEADARIDGYSRGMRQKIGIIQALLHEPAVVFFDEPLSGLDPRAVRTFRDAITHYSENDGTVVLSTHVLGLLEAVADQVGVIHDGRLVAAGHTQELICGHNSLEDLFLTMTDDDRPVT